MRIQAMSRKETEKQPRDTALARFDGGSEVASRNIVIAREMARLEPMPEQADKAAFVAREVAAAERIPADEIAKTVAYFGDNGFGMVVLPADCLVNFAEVGRLMGLSHVRLASEAELAGLFPGSDLGAMPPFWNETEMPVLVDENVAAAEFIAFNAGTHRDVIRMSLADFRRLVNPLIAAFAVKERVLASI